VPEAALGRGIRGKRKTVNEKRAAKESRLNRFPFPVSRFPALARLESLSPRGVRLGLEAIGAACGRLGRPERSVPSLLIAGTNGKGSTAAMLDALAGSAGLRAGLYTSPHLMDVTERIRICGADVTETRLDEALARVFQACDRSPAVPLTYFEALTAAAFWIFSEERLGLAILEVGLGGRFDATNVAPALASTVTSISVDHTPELGTALDGIAREKAGVFRAGRPALARAASPMAREALREAAGLAGAEWHDADEELSVSTAEVSLSGVSFELSTPERRASLRTALPGLHQAWNAALAVRTAELAPDIFGSLSAESVERGLRSVRWPGRIEALQAGGRTVLLDGCHNPEGAAALADFLSDAGIAGACPLVFGAMADKDVEGIARVLFPRARSVWLVAAPSERAATCAELARRTDGFAHDVRCEANVASALRALLSRPAGAPIIVAGSLYLVGEARRLLLGGAPF
jgi:dihydrofolate synthase/folylpolyglutamate synthase